MTAQGLLPIHPQAAELIMPGMGALHLPSARLSTWLRRGVVTAPALGRNMPQVALLQDDLPRRGVSKGGIQTQVLRGMARGLGPNDRGIVEQGGQHGAVV